MTATSFEGIAVIDVDDGLLLIKAFDSALDGHVLMIYEQASDTWQPLDLGITVLDERIVQLRGD